MESNDRIDKLEQKVDQLADLIMSLVKKPDPALPPQVIQEPDDDTDLKPKDFQELASLLNSNKWPEAIDPGLICDINSDQDKEDRAEGILELIIDVHMEGLKFLDYGCGEGHVVNRIREQKPRIAVGYDIERNAKWDEWEQSHNTLFTTDWSEVKESGPYNVILLYDVLDHMDYNYDALIVKMKELKSVLAPNGRIYVRTHPWCSRHGTHLYTKLNKAFVHLVFTEEELELMGITQQKVRKIKLPLFEYNNIFSAAGFRIQGGPYHVKKAVEPFIKKIEQNKKEKHSSIT